MTVSWYLHAQHDLRQGVLPRLACVGDFDSSGGRWYSSAVTQRRIVSLDTAQENPEVAKKKLKIPETITCMCVARPSDRDLLVVGTTDSVQCYDVAREYRVFATRVDDGVASMCAFGDRVYAGSNCAIYGFDVDGAEVFWTVTGDVVTALCEYQQRSIVAATRDHLLQQLVGDEVRKTKQAKGEVCALLWFGDNRFAAADVSGEIVGFVDFEASWRVQAPDFCGMFAMDSWIVYGSGAEIRISESANGRALKTHDVGIGRLAAIAPDDRGGAVVFGAVGKIMILIPNRVDGLGDEARRTFELTQAQPKLIARKRELLARIWELENNTGGVVRSANVTVEYSLGHRLDQHSLELKLATRPATPISGTILGDGPTGSFHFNQEGGATQSILFFPDPTAKETKMNVIVSGHGYACVCSHRAFIGYLPCEFEAPANWVQFQWTDAGTLNAFLEENFSAKGSSCCFRSIRDDSKIAIQYDGQCVTIGGELELCGKILNWLCDTAKVGELESRAHFPSDSADLTDESWQTTGALRANRKAGVSAIIQQIKDSVVRLKDAASLELWGDVITAATDLGGLHSQLERERNVAVEGDDSALGLLIQKFAALRRGNCRADFIRRCRRELAARDFKRLAHVLEFGHSGRTYRRKSS